MALQISVWAWAGAGAASSAAAASRTRQASVARPCVLNRDMTHPVGSRLSALGSRLSALGSRLSALGSRLSALGSRLSALGSRLSALGSRLSALGSRLSAHIIVCIGKIVCIGDGVQRSPTTLDMPASRTAGHGPLALAGATSSFAPGPSPLGCAARHWPIAARRPGSVSANTALVCCDCFIGRLPHWEDSLARTASAPAFADRRFMRSV